MQFAGNGIIKSVRIFQKKYLNIAMSGSVTSVLGMHNYSVNYLKSLDVSVQLGWGLVQVQHDFQGIWHHEVHCGAYTT